MVDDSKHTEEADMSRYDYYADTVSQDTGRDLQRKSEIDTTQTLDLRTSNLNMVDDDSTNNQRKGSKSRKNKKKTQDIEQSHQIKVYSNEDEESKTHDCINQDEDYKHQRFNTEGADRVTKPKIGTFQLKAHLPHIKINIPMAVTGNEVFEIFTAICKAHAFQVIEMDQNIATAVNKEPFSFKKILQRCIPFSDSRKETETMISAVRLQITINDIKCCRKVSLKGLYGDPAKLQDFQTQFKNRLHLLVQNTPQTPQKIDEATPKSRMNTQMGRKRPGMMVVHSDDDSDSEQKSSGYNETSSIYQIHKILSSDQYTLGKNVAQYIQCFHLQYKSLRESANLLPQPMESIMSLIQETVHSFNSEYNLGKETAKGLMTYCRPQVEKYIFSKLYDKLFAMYAIKNEDEDKLFAERAGQIKRIRAHDVMHYLGIKQQFIIGENNAHSLKFEDHIKDTGIHYESHRSDLHNLMNNDNLFNNTSTSSLGGGISSIIRNELPYGEAIKALEKMQQFQSPREKLQCLSESFGALKTTIVDHWKGKIELNAMDDVLPLSIYVVSMSDLSHPASEFNIMEDYLSLYDKGFEFERKLLTNFDVSIRYINHEWELQPTN